MPKYTTNLNLFKYDPSTDAQTAFSITNALNNNWDKIDTAIVNVDGLPSQSGHSGDLLTTNGSTASWADTATVYPVIQTYKSGTSWYRVYSDGWCEQGGYTTTNGTYAISLLKTMKDTNYSISLTESSTNTSNPGGSQNSIPIKGSCTINSIYVYINTTSGLGAYWEVKGYIGV